jgi:hypothetical protein
VKLLISQLLLAFLIAREYHFLLKEITMNLVMVDFEKPLTVRLGLTLRSLFNFFLLTSVSMLHKSGRCRPGEVVAGPGSAISAGNW